MSAEQVAGKFLGGSVTVAKVSLYVIISNCKRSGHCRVSGIKRCRFVSQRFKSRYMAATQRLLLWIAAKKTATYP